MARAAPVAFLGIVVWLAAFLAAAAAHVMIDIAGDYALAHDAYDGMAHHSRSIVVVVVIALGLIAVLGLLLSALEEPHTSTGALRALVSRARAVPAYRLVAAIAALAVVTLVAMQSLDALLETGRINNLSDAFGGSTLFGLTITVLSGVLAGVITARLLRSLAAAHRTIVATVRALLVRGRPACGTPRSFIAAVALDARPGAASVLWCHAARRAPPSFFV